MSRPRARTACRRSRSRAIASRRRRCARRAPPRRWTTSPSSTLCWLTDRAQRPAPVRVPGAPVLGAGAALVLLGAKVGQSDAAVGIAQAAVALRAAPLGHLALGLRRAPAPRAERERSH